MKTDLRAWLNAVEAHSEIKTVHGADWNKEIGTLVELNAKARGPALLFDNIKDYPAGFRLLAGAMSSAKRLATCCSHGPRYLISRDCLAWRARERNTACVASSAS